MFGQSIGGHLSTLIMLLPSPAVYCIGIFALMLLSLLETIVVMHLMAKDSQASKDNEPDEGRSSSEADNQQGKAHFQSSSRPGVSSLKIIENNTEHYRWY